MISRRTLLQSAISMFPASSLAQSRAVYFSDFNRCQPQTSLSRESKRNHWRLLPYESDAVNGTMLIAGQNTAAPEIRIPIERRGWHAIYFGIRSAYGESRIEARLKSESIFCLLTHHDMIGMKIERRDIEFLGTSFHSRSRVDDLFWKYADLTGEEIVLRQPVIMTDAANPTGFGTISHPVWLAYLKLVPLTDTAVTQLQRDRAGNTHRRLFAHNDAFGSTGWLRTATEDSIRREIEPYRNTDFSRIYWEAGMGDRMYYPTKIGLRTSDRWIADPFRVRDRLNAESYREFEKRGGDPFRTAAEAVHNAGLEFHAAYRVAGFHFPPPEDEWNRGGVYDKHPEWRGLDREGHQTPRLSYAYEGVRRYVISLLEEMARYAVDGLCLLFNRRPPLLEYEPPLLEGFEKATGKDARKLPEDDREWLQYRASVLTAFLRDVRKLANSQPKPLHVSAVVMGTLEQNLRYGMDIAAWAREGLVDTLIPYSSGSTLNSALDSFTNPRDAEPFLNLLQGSSCRLAPNLMPRQIQPEDYRRRANALYQSGVENLFFWDCYQRCDFSHSWSALRRLGHREELKAWADAGSPPLDRPGTILRKLGDWDLRYETPG